ncbi:uncharacterized protein [Elaeis guineensis]|uniref:uncharacterized protein isoform X2 n=1 Tax=Elaeis guineensis var. tenera TaxID=51953 RepID=UPI003C6D68B6
MLALPVIFFAWWVKRCILLLKSRLSWNWMIVCWTAINFKLWSKYIQLASCFGIMILNGVLDARRSCKILPVTFLLLRLLPSWSYRSAENITHPYSILIKVLAGRSYRSENIFQHPK